MSAIRWHRGESRYVARIAGITAAVYYVAGSEWNGGWCFFVEREPGEPGPPFTFRRGFIEATKAMDAAEWEMLRDVS